MLATKMKNAKLNIGYLIGFLLLMVNCHAQQQKPSLTSADYHKWGMVQQEQIAANGQWISYVLKYDSGLDTLFVQNTQTHKRMPFPKGSKNQFSPDAKWFTVSNPQERLTLVNLNNNVQKIVDGVLHYEYTADSRYLCLLVKTTKGSSLQIMDLKTAKEYLFSGISAFTIGRTNAIAVIDSAGVSILQPKADFAKKQLFRNEETKLKNIIWNPSATAVAFMQELPKDRVAGGHKVYYYNLNEQRLSSFDPITKPELSQQHIVTKGGPSPLFFSADGQKLFFAMAPPKENMAVANAVEIWDSNLPLDYPSQQFSGNASSLPKIVRWTPETNELLQLGTTERPNVLLSLDRKMAITYNKLQYEPQIQMEAPADLYVMTIENSKEKLFLKKQDMTLFVLGASPDGQYISYYREQNWWIYDVKNDIHKNLTARLGVPFYEIDFDSPGPIPPYGNPGWSNDGKILLYDQYDIWMIAVDGSAERMTNGRENKIRYRIPATEIQQFRPFSSLNIGRPPISVSHGVLLEALGSQMESGYSLYTPNKKLKKLIYGKSSCSLIRKAAQGNTYLYVEQTANTPPRVLFAPTLTKEPKVLFQSNPQYANYDAGQAELIAYATEKEKDLKGILYYPKGYTAEKKYPMVVYIYEKLSGEFHKYMRPTWFDGDGFNAVNYTLDGYLVLMPDIKLEVGEPGKSAVACVLAAVDAVSKKGILDRNRIGLIGHSFGGYEVPYILTQTSLFKAGVAGAGITDMISNYFFFHEATEHSNMWRYETQQLRMGKTPFEDYQAYIRNSPIAHADKITTPLLLWSGKEDNNVPPEQSMELYMALRRLNKRNLLLLYPEENHIIQKTDNQIDLNLRIKNWFDYYLKGSETKKPH